MNALIYCVNEIKSQIPEEILHYALNCDETPETINLTSNDNKLLTKVIKSRVLLDTNIVGGIEAIIPLQTLQPSYSESYYTVYYIPPELTMNKEIISALSVTYLPGKGFFGPYNVFYSNATFNAHSNFNSALNVATRVGTSTSDMSVVSNAHLELVAYNTVLVYANYRSLLNYGIRVVLENNNNLSNISPRSYKALSYLCVLATKAYIYNKTIIKINSGVLQSGQELGVFKSIIESYENAEEEYRTYLKETWTAVAFMNDTTRLNRFISSMIQPDL